MHTDCELLLALKVADEQAFEEIYRRYWAAMYTSAFHILRDGGLAQDVVQDIFTWLWENREVIEISTLKTYLHTAVKFKVANHWRHIRVTEKYMGQADNPAVDNPQSKLETAELAKLISDFTLQLPPKCKRVFMLSRDAHLSNREIATHLSISEKTVENQITTALKKLRVSLAKNLLFFLSIL